MSCDPKYFREKVFTFAKERLRKLFEDLKELDSRFQLDDSLGYIRFNTTQGASEYVVSRAYCGMTIRLKPKFWLDGSLDGFDSLYSNYDETYRRFNWLYPETYVAKPNWQEDLEKECKIVYDAMVDALKEEAEMKRKCKIWEIRRAANVFS